MPAKARSYTFKHLIQWACRGNQATCLRVFLFIVTTEHFFSFCCTNSGGFASRQHHQTDLFLLTQTTLWQTFIPYHCLQTHHHLLCSLCRHCNFRCNGSLSTLHPSENFSEKVLSVRKRLLTRQTGYLVAPALCMCMSYSCCGLWALMQNKSVETLVVEVADVFLENRQFWFSKKEIFLRLILANLKHKWVCCLVLQ